MCGEFDDFIYIWVKHFTTKTKTKMGNNISELFERKRKTNQITLLNE